MNGHFGMTAGSFGEVSIGPGMITGHAGNITKRHDMVAQRCGVIAAEIGYVSEHCGTIDKCWFWTKAFDCLLIRNPLAKANDKKYKIKPLPILKMRKPPT